MTGKRTQKKTDLYGITAVLPAGLEDIQAGGFASALGDEDSVLSSSLARENGHHNGRWIAGWLVEGRPDKALLAKIEALGPESLSVEEVPDDDWLARSYRQFAPFAVAEFFIFGSHYDGPAPAGSVPLQIDAATAFGSGSHGTTSGCLRALSALKREGFAPRNILDMGTGSGILAVAARKLWPEAKILAADIDEESVRVARRHAELNGVTMAYACGDGFAAEDVRRAAPFDLIIANILAAPLIEMAPALAAALAPEGKAVLSGLLAKQAAEVMAAYEPARLREITRLADAAGEWTTLLLEKPA